MKRVVVIIVNFNSGHRLEGVYRSLAAQTFDDFDVIVIDNASTDDSADTPIPTSLSVNVIRSSTNTGFAGGVMDAVAHAQAPWIAVLNPDAYPAADWLDALMRAAAQYGEQTALGSVQLSDENPEILDGLGDAYHISGTAWRGAFGKSSDLRPTGDQEIFAPCFAATLLHRETFLERGGLDTDFFCYHEDVDYGFRHRLAGGRAVLVHDAVVRHEGSGITGRYSPFTVFHGIRNRQWTLYKNMPLALLPVAIPVFLAFSAVFLIRSFMLGFGPSYCRGWWAGLKGLPAAWRKRGPRRASLGTICRAMTWSPLAPFQRAPHFMEITPTSPPSSTR